MMKLIKHNKGSHYSNCKGFNLKVSSLFSKKVEHYVWAGMFNSDSMYPELSKENDWNKLIGVSFWPLTSSRKNSVMVAWRYNHEKRIFQLTPYYHEKDKTTHGKFSEFPIIDVPANVMFYIDLYIDYKKAKITLEVKTDTKGLYNPFTDYINTNIKYDAHPLLGYVFDKGFLITLHDDDLFKMSKFHRIINPYFGGNNPAPKDVYLFLGRFWKHSFKYDKDTQEFIQDYSHSNIDDKIA